MKHCKPFNTNTWITYFSPCKHRHTHIFLTECILHHMYTLHNLPHALTTFFLLLHTIIFSLLTTHCTRTCFCHVRVQSYKYIYVYIYVYTYMNKYVYIVYVYTHVYTFMYMYMFMYIYKYMYTYIYIYIHTCTYVQMCMYISRTCVFHGRIQYVVCN